MTISKQEQKALAQQLAAALVGIFPAMLDAYEADDPSAVERISALSAQAATNGDTFSAQFMLEVALLLHRQFSGRIPKDATHIENIQRIDPTKL